MRRVLVTGGAGFIGSHLCAALLAMGCDVMSFDALIPQVHPQRPNWPDYQPDHERLMKYCGDVRVGPNVVLHALENFQPDTVIHLAAYVGVGQSATHPAGYTSCNVTGTMALLEYILQYNAQTDKVHQVQQVFVAGSMSSYGEGSIDYYGDEPTPTGEEHPLTPTSIYAWTKAQAEIGAIMLGKMRGLDVKVGRFFNCYGPHQALTNPYTGVGAIFAARIMAGLPPIIYEDGSQSRDFIHVSDIVSGIIAIVQHGTPFQPYNIGTGTATSVLQLANAIAVEIAVQTDTDPIPPMVTGLVRAGDIRHCYADVSLIKRLGWDPKVKLEDGIRDLISWVKDQPAEQKQELLDRAHNELIKMGLLIPQEEAV